MIKLKPGFLIDRYHRCDRSDHMKPSQRQQSMRYKKFYLSDRCRCDHWRVVSIWSLNFFFSAIAAITAVVAIIWKPDLIYRNDHPPFLLNCYLYALQTYRTHSSKLRLLLVIKVNYNYHKQSPRILWGNQKRLTSPYLFRTMLGFF